MLLLLDVLVLKTPSDFPNRNLWAGGVDVIIIFVVFNTWFPMQPVLRVRNPGSKYEFCK